jgi:plastocyanin
MKPQPQRVERKPAPKPVAKEKPEPAITAAASSSVAIENFVYSPATVNVNVGDSVTWTNGDSAPHTATGDGFDTGTLNEGESGSATFSSAGTFDYICALHPNMKGTVVVAGSGGGGSDPGSGSTPGDAPSDPPSAAGSSGLPQTGFELSTVVLLGILMIASGVRLHRLGAVFSPRG